MKKICFSLLAGVLLAALASCGPDQGLGGREYEGTLENYTSPQGTVIEMRWAKGDRVTIYGTGGSGVYSASPHNPASSASFSRMSGDDVAAPCRAFYPQSLTTDGSTVTLPATQSTEDGGLHYLPMYAESADENLRFRNICGALRFHLTKNGVNVSTVKISAGSTMNGTFRVSYNGGSPTLTHTAGGTNTILLECATPQNLSGGRDLYIALPPGTYSGMQVEMTTTDSRYCMVSISQDVSIQRSVYTTINLGEDDLTFMEPRHEGTLTGLFSVSYDRKVRFSQGNLQYRPNSGTWRFAETQYSFIGTANNKISATYSGWIDLFGYGTGDRPALYSSQYYDYNTFVDWSANPISNGGDRANVWRTLSTAEWNHLFSLRQDAVEKWTTGSVNGLNGLILLPDDWNQPNGISFAPADIGWKNNRFSIAQWNQMEAAGAVFLPAGGVRLGRTNIGYVGTGGFYWSSDNINEQYAYCVYFGSTGMQATYTLDRSSGVSVRPVRDDE